MNKPLTLGFSPCPNDTFMFEAMVRGMIDTEGLSFDYFMEDVETLNRKAILGEADIIKISYHAYAYVSAHYQLLHAGSALGRGCGPLLISRDELKPDDPKLSQLKTGIPGDLTTANFLLGLAYPALQNKVIMPFNRIEEALLNGEIDLGLIIHENRFTYEQKGLKKVLDLGSFWEKMTGYPIPLGGIAVRRTFSPELQQSIERVLRRSIEYAFQQNGFISAFIREHAQEMDEQVMRQHIDLYVTDFSLDTGMEGTEAVHALFQKAQEAGMIATAPASIFIGA